MNPTFLYVTAPTRDEALRLARTLVEERFAACANVFPEMTSVYRWEGAIQEDAEVAMIVKTREDLVERVVDRISELHPYSCPCVIALSVTGGNPGFLQWIADETRLDP